VRVNEVSVTLTRMIGDERGRRWGCVPRLSAQGPVLACAGMLALKKPHEAHSKVDEEVRPPAAVLGRTWQGRNTWELPKKRSMDNFINLE
jgi:hypothetical protein